MNRKEKLLRLRKILEDISPERQHKFDMMVWINHDAIHMSNLTPEFYLEPNSKLQDPACGTYACALGWACLDEELYNQGLRARMIGGRLIPTFDGAQDTYAGAKFFEISPSDAEYLFVPSTYSDGKIKPEHVIHRIDNLMSFFSNTGDNKEGT